MVIPKKYKKKKKRKKKKVFDLSLPVAFTISSDINI